MKYLKVFKNWRIATLTVMFMATLVLIAGDGDRIGLVVFSKLIGFALGALGYKLGKEWMKDGKLDELNVFNDDE